MSEEVYQLGAKRLKQLNEVDMMPGDLRACVHEFGYPIVKSCLDVGVREPRHIRQLVKEIWLGGRQGSQTGGALYAVDTLLSHGVVSLKGLVRMLNDSSMTIAPIEPTRAMLDASLEEVSGYNIRCTKEEKHRRRLRAALKAARDEMMKV